MPRLNPVTPSSETQTAPPAEGCFDAVPSYEPPHIDFDDLPRAETETVPPGEVLSCYAPNPLRNPACFAAGLPEGFAQELVPKDFCEANSSLTDANFFCSLEYDVVLYEGVEYFATYTPTTCAGIECAHGQWQNNVARYCDATGSDYDPHFCEALQEANDPEGENLLQCYDGPSEEDLLECPNE